MTVEILAQLLGVDLVQPPIDRVTYLLSLAEEVLSDVTLDPTE